MRPIKVELVGGTHDGRRLEIPYSMGYLIGNGLVMPRMGAERAIHWKAQRPDALTYPETEMYRARSTVAFGPNGALLMWLT